MKIKTKDNHYIQKYIAHYSICNKTTHKTLNSFSNK